MWNCIAKLPLELMGQQVLGLLSVKDLVNLDSALISRIVRSEFLTMLKHCLPLNYDPRLVGYQWLKKKKCRISRITLSLSQKDCFEIDTSIIESIELNADRIPTMDDINKLNQNHFVRKITKLYISHIGGNSGRLINQMMSVLANLVIITISASEDSHLTWLKDMEPISNNIEEIQVYTPLMSYYLANFITQCKKLKKLHSFNVTRWEEDPNSFLGTLGTNCPCLDCFYAYNPSKTLVQDTGIIALAQGCPYLHTLFLSVASALTDTSVLALAQHCPNLQSVILFGANKLTPSSLIALSERRLPRKSLDIPWIPIDSAEVAAQCAHALSRIRIPPAPTKSVQFCLPYMSPLKDFTLERSMEVCQAEAVLADVAAHCRQLHTVSVCGSTEAILQQLIILASTNPCLTSVTLYKATTLTDLALTEIVRHCPRLINISISHSPSLTDTGLIALSELCLQLRCVSLHSCTQIMYTSLNIFLQNCFNLDSLGVIKCPLFTDSCLLALSKHAQHLDRLYIKDCNEITEVAIIELVQNCHKLSVLWAPSAVLSEFTKWQLLSQRNSDLYRTGHTRLTIYLV